MQKSSGLRFTLRKIASRSCFPGARPAMVWQKWKALLTGLKRRIVQCEGFDTHFFRLPDQTSI